MIDLDACSLEHFLHILDNIWGGHSLGVRSTNVSGHNSKIHYKYVSTML